MKTFCIITATYNRAHTIGKLYSSLCNQGFTDFTWIVVDDGSVDNTEELINSWKKQAKFEILYIHQANKGKHRAINNGVKHADSLWCAVIDSDDWITDNCLERTVSVIDAYKINQTSKIAAIIFLSKYPDESIVGSRFPLPVYIGKTYSYYNKRKIKGDKFDFYKTDALKKNPFPEIDGEKFISEGIVWNRINREYNSIFVDEAHQYVEYQCDGLSAASILHRASSPLGACLGYRESIELDAGIKKKVLSIINYYRFRIRCDKKKLSMLISRPPRKIYSFFLPLGYFFYLIDELKLKKLESKRV